jgi:hypothetical protein
MGNGRESRWRVVGKSVRGASHVRTGLPNQDAIRWLPKPGTGLPLVLAVSDGHGSARCFRSNVGSRIAVETATGVIQEFLASLPEPLNLSAIKRWAGESLPREIVRRWRDGVADHVTANPLTSTELDTLETEKGVSGRRQAVLEPIFAYGATLLTVLVAESFILYLQLGDGDILIVSETGEVSRPPLPADERLFANETTSLCSRDAWREFRGHFQVLSGPLPALILVSTDGYGNSFRDEAGFLQVGTDFLEMTRADGLDAVHESLETWLAEASQEGSGDDITLGILCRMDALKDASKVEMPAGRIPAGQLSSVEEEAGVVMARCSQSGQDFGIRFEEKRLGHWIANWAFDSKETPARKEEYGRREITGALEFDAAYPGCPHCGAPSIFQCVCGQVACWDGKSHAVTCPWCGTAVELRDPIGSLSARSDR